MTNQQRLTPVVRGAFPVTPMHVISAPEAGSGKSYLLGVAAAVALGQPCPVMAAGRTEEETEKRLGAALLTGQLYATGNKIRLVGDIARRVLRCRLDSGMEEPERRRFWQKPGRHSFGLARPTQSTP